MNENQNQLAVTNNGVATHIRQATDVAGACREIVMKTAQQIGRGDKKYVRVEGWQSIAVAHGCVASARDVERVEDGYRCIGEVKRMDNGQVISQAEGFLGDDEEMWSKRPVYARRAMVQTRAISRACRSAFAHVVVLIDSGLSTTPAEEVPHGGFEDINTDKYEAPAKEAVKIVTEVTNQKSTEERDIVLKFGKWKGVSVRQIARSEDGLNYLEWLAKQPLKEAADGKPYKNDIVRNEIIAEVLMAAEGKEVKGEGDDIPF
jgi:hypothetical protein